MDKSGALYFLVNDSMPGLVKIGHTTGSVKDRVRQLCTTGVPTEFKVSCIFYVDESAKCEASVHKALVSFREKPNREFFRGSVAELLAASISEIESYSGSVVVNKIDKPIEFEPTEIDIYFMQYFLHDGYETSTAQSATALSQHHLDYAPLELERRFLLLEKHGYLKRVNRIWEGMGMWMLLPQGVEFMLDNGHELGDLIKEARN